MSNLNFIAEELAKITEGLIDNNDFDLYDNGKRIDISVDMLEHVLQIAGAITLLNEDIPAELKTPEIQGISAKFTSSILSGMAAATMALLFDEDSPLHMGMFKKGGDHRAS